MQDVKIANLELFYDVLIESNEVLFEEFHSSYFDLIEMTINNILEEKILQDLDDTTYEKLEKCYHKLDGHTFTKEDIRKSLQSVILLGMKEDDIPNGYTTPDTIGIFISYLISKMIKKEEINLLDPMSGTGNLLFTISNYLDKDINRFAVDNDELMTRITKMFSDMLSYPTEIYLENILDYDQKGFDVITIDMPHQKEKDSYFPYDVILHLKNMLNDDGALIAILENDFFDYDKDKTFIKELLSNMSLVGIVELPDDMFKSGKPKIILALQKCKLDSPCFMVKLPNFKEEEAFKNALGQVEMWFLKNRK